MTIPSYPWIGIVHANALAFIHTSGRASLGGVHVSTCNPNQLVTTCTQRMQSKVLILGQEQCSMTKWDANPFKGHNQLHLQSTGQKEIKRKKKGFTLPRVVGPKAQFLARITILAPSFYPYTNISISQRGYLSMAQANANQLSNCITNLVCSVYLCKE